MDIKTPKRMFASYNYLEYADVGRLVDGEADAEEIFGTVFLSKIFPSTYKPFLNFGFPILRLAWHSSFVVALKVATVVPAKLYVP